MSSHTIACLKCCWGVQLITRLNFGWLHVSNCQKKWSVLSPYSTPTCRFIQECDSKHTCILLKLKPCLICVFCFWAKWLLKCVKVVWNTLYSYCTILNLIMVFNRWFGKNWFCHHTATSDFTISLANIFNHHTATDSWDVSRVMVHLY